MQNILVMDWVKIALFQEENNYEELLQFIDEVMVRVKDLKSEEVMFTARINYLEYTKGDTYYHLGDFEKAQKDIKQIKF